MPGGGEKEGRVCSLGARLQQTWAGHTQCSISSAENSLVGLYAKPRVSSLTGPTHQESHKGTERRDPWRTHAAVAQELPLILTSPTGSPECV